MITFVREVKDALDYITISVEIQDTREGGMSEGREKEPAYSAEDNLVNVPLLAVSRS